MDNFFGQLFGGVPSGLEEYMTEEQKQAIQRNAMLTAAAALLQAGGPSTTRTSLGQALGTAMLSGQKAASEGQSSAIQSLLNKQKLDEYKQELDTKKMIKGILEGSAAPDATAVPVAGVAGATAPARAQAPAGNANAEMYRKIGNALMATSPEKAKAYFDAADKIDPRDEAVGDPFRVADATGKTVLVQRYKSGKIQPISGYAPEVKPMGQPFEAKNMSGKTVLVQQFDDGTYKSVDQYGVKSDIVMQDIGGKVIAVDKNAIKPGATYSKTLAPQVVGGGETGYYVIGGGGGGAPSAGAAPRAGGAGVAPSATAPAAGGLQPIIPGTGPKPTESQAAAVGFANRMERADSYLNALSNEGEASYMSNIAGSVPFVGGQLQRWTMNPVQQQYSQAASDWIRAKLRKESGAVIGDDEMQKEYETYFPMPGDSQQVIQQKAEARRVATQAMIAQAGKSYTPYKMSEGDIEILSKRPESTKKTPPAVGEIRGGYMFLGGDPKDQKNYRKVK